jgi:hypothetical protein
MGIRVGVVGISGYGGGDAMCLVAGHPSFELAYAPGEGSAGSRSVDKFPGAPANLAALQSKNGTRPPYPSWTSCSLQCRQAPRLLCVKTVCQQLSEHVPRRSE